jgi:hypothetical protein
MLFDSSARNRDAANSIGPSPTLRNSQLSTPREAARAFWTPLRVLSVLMLGDFLFIAAHLVHLESTLLPSIRWDISHDHGFGEIFQYLKFAGICVALGRLFVRTRMRALLGWIGVFAFLLLDDAGRIHERSGLALAAWLHLADFAGLRGRDIGELIFELFAGLLVIPTVVFGCWRSAQPARAISADLTVLLLALAACGVGADLVHQMLSATSMNTFAGLIEDGGEMLVLSLTCAYIAQWMSEAAQIRFRPARYVHIALFSSSR